MNLRRRGHALALTLALLVAATLLFAVVLARVDGVNAGRRDDEARVQALWLARSAVAAGVRGDRVVQLGRERAEVNVRSRREGRATRVWAEARWRGAVAAVDALLGPGGRRLEWQERFTPAPPTPGKR